MKLKSITVGGFKNLAKTKLMLDGIVAIVSPNNYGKSNLLEAIDFGVEFIFSSPKERQMMMSWSRGIPINKDLDKEDFSFEVEFQDDSLNDYKFVKYGYSFSWYKDDGSGQKITNEWLEARVSESVRYTAYIKRDEGKYRKSKETSAFRKINIDNNQLIIEMLAAIPDVSVQAIASSIKKLDYHVCASLDVRSRFQASPVEFVAEATDNGVAFDDEDVPRALYQLSKVDSKKYNLFLEAIYSLFPEFSDIKVQSYELKKEDFLIEAVTSTGDGVVKDSSEKSKENIPFRIKDELYRLLLTSNYLNQQINMSMMSTGTKRVFWLLANAFIASSKHISCFGVEELETSIHPKLLKMLLEILNEAIDDTSVIISSHSPYLIQYLKPDCLYIGVPNDFGIATFKKIKASCVRNLINVARGNSMSVGEYLFELMSGDSDGAELLSLYLED